MGSDSASLLELKTLLQKLTPRQFEQLAAALIGRLLDVPIAVAKSGFQFGGDGGPAGRAQRSFRLETKRYGDNTSLSDRELLGEIDHAIARDSGLEGWFLVATREVPEQLEMDLADKSAKVGVPDPRDGKARERPGSGVPRTADQGRHWSLALLASNSGTSD